MKKYIIILFFYCFTSCGQVVLLDKTYYKIYFDTQAMLPKYTKEVLTLSAYTTTFQRKQVKADPLINRNLQGKHRDYRKDTLFDIGHLVPIIDNNFSQDAVNATNVFTNTAPQYFNLNRGVWRDLELFIKQLHYSTNQTVTVWSGIDYGYRNIGKLKIPTFFWKLILINGNYFAWQFPNKNPYNLNYNSYQIDPTVIRTKINSVGFENLQ